MSPIHVLGQRNVRECCPVCTRPVFRAAHVVRLHGAPFHPECVLYQRQSLARDAKRAR